MRILNELGGEFEKHYLAVVGKVLKLINGIRKTCMQL